MVEEPHMKTRPLSLFALIALLLMVGMVTPALGQATPTPARVNEIEITGIATALNTGTITVGGRLIDTTQAEFKDAITVGALVKVHYSVAANGTLVAREVELASNDDLNDDFEDFNDDEFEMVGIADAVTATTITVGGQIINIAQAELNDIIAVGALVKIHFSVDANGVLAAREVELASNDDLDDDFDDDDRGGQGQIDDNGNDGPGHDLNDDHGDDRDDDHSGSDSGRGGDDGDDGDDHSDSGRGSDDGEHGDDD
jgi:hypothetical protein